MLIIVCNSWETATNFRSENVNSFFKLHFFYYNSTEAGLIQIIMKYPVKLLGQ